jgi:hypothetical protein
MKKYESIISELKSIDISCYDPEIAKKVIDKASKLTYNDEIIPTIRELYFRLMERFRKNLEHPELVTELFNKIESWLEPKIAYKIIPYLDNKKNIVDLRLKALQYVSLLGRKSTLPENLQDLIVKTYFLAIDKKETNTERTIAHQALKTIYIVNHPQKKIILNDFESKLPIMAKRAKKELKEDGIDIEL